MINKNLSNKNTSKDNTKNNEDKVTENKKEELDEETKPTIKLENAPNNSSEFINLKDGEYLTKTNHTLIIKNNIAYVDGHLIVNKTYSIPETYKPINTKKEIPADKCEECLENDVLDAFYLMQSDAKSLGLNIYLASGYRSYNYQNKLYTNYSNDKGREKADTFSARPGHSEHQTGLCFDLNSVDDSFANTDEGLWINNNAYLYGFIIRYPKGKDNITGYQYESWHLRYVGVDLAKILYNNGNWITMEEYYGLSSSY